MFSAKRYLENIAAVQNTTELDQFMVKYFPKRRMLFIRNIVEIHLATTPDNTQGTTLGWENTLYALRKYLVDHHLPAALAASAGCMIEKESLLRRELCIRNFCIPVDENIEDENVSYIPEGSFLTFTPQTLTNADGALMEGYYINEMLDEIARSDCEVAGDYYAEAIAPGIFNNVRHSVTRMQIAVKLAWPAFRRE